jgi:transcriptional regulator with XRE-family HTH domain
MLIGEVLKAVRVGKKMSQGDIEQKTGMIRSYISRVENGHTIPSPSTLEKFARALDVPLWQIIRGTSEGSIPGPIVKQQKDAASTGAGNDIRRVEQAMLRLSAKSRKMLVGLAVRIAR